MSFLEVGASLAPLLGVLVLWALVCFVLLPLFDWLLDRIGQVALWLQGDLARLEALRQERGK